MQGAGNRPPGATRAGRRHAQLLVELLSDDSPVVQREVRAALTRAGRSARHALEKASRGQDGRVRARARMVLLERARRRAWGRLCGYVSRTPSAPVDRLDLEYSLLLLSAYLSPGLDLRTYRRALDALGEGLRKRVYKTEAGIGRALLIGHYLGTELGYRGDRKDNRHPDNLNLARAIERKRGLPLTLAALYRSVAQRAGLRAEVLPLPGHVLVRIEEGETRPILDPFDGGRPLAEADCRAYIKRHGIPWNRAWLEAAPHGLILQRQVANARRSARERGWGREVRRLTQLHSALAARLRAPAGRTS